MIPIPRYAMERQSSSSSVITTGRPRGVSAEIEKPRANNPIHKRTECEEFNQAEIDIDAGGTACSRFGKRHEERNRDQEGREYEPNAIRSKAAYTKWIKQPIHLAHSLRSPPEPRPPQERDQYDIQDDISTEYALNDSFRKDPVVE